MALIVAIRNQNSIVVASDSEKSDDAALYGQCMPLANHVVIMLAGNLDAIRAPVTKLLPSLSTQAGAFAVAQLLHAELSISVVPGLDEFKGRTEIIIAGFDHGHHNEPAPAMFYMDSAQLFQLMPVKSNAVACGATAALRSLLDQNHDFATATTEQLKVLAKECMSATKLKWPASIVGQIRIGAVYSDHIQLQTY